MSLQILQHLIEANRLPRYVLAQDPSTSTGSWRTSLKRAIAGDIERISFNTSKFVNCITIDYDGDAAEEHRWEDFGLPPTISVANLPGSRSGRPGRHDTYFLKDPVFSGGIATKPLSYARFIRRALTAQLGGDPHFTNLLTKSPWHSRHRLTTPQNWTRNRQQGFYYTLDYIANRIDLDYWTARFKKEDARRGSAMPALDDSARNASLFDAARLFAYAMPDFDPGALAAFIEEQNLLFIEPLRISETRSITKSITKFMFTRYAGRGGLGDIQAARGRASGAARRAKSQGPEIARRLAAGETRAQVAEDLGKNPAAVKKAAQRARRRQESGC